MPGLSAASMMPGGGKAPPPDMSGSGRGLGRDSSLDRQVAIVEDELMVAWSLETMIEDLGYEVTATFARGEAALAGIDGERTDIVLMDINLGGGLDGVETAKRLRADHGCRIIFISAYGDPATRDRIAQQVPGALLLRKPVSAALLALALSGESGRSN